MIEYINERMKDFAMNIDEFSIGQIVLDKFDNSVCKIVNKTINSIEVYIKRKSKKGIDTTQWFDMRQFNFKFKK